MSPCSSPWSNVPRFPRYPCRRVSSLIMSVFLVFKLVFSLIDKEVDERPAGRRVGLVSQDMDYDNSFGLSRILRPLTAPSVVVNVNPVHVFPLIDKEVDGPRSGVGLVMVPVFLFSRLGWPGVWGVDFFVRAKTMVLIRVIVENMV